jgi:hypothetical protein
MYGLPKDFDTKFLLNQRLWYVVFSESSVTFNFGDQLSITVSASFQHDTAKDVLSPIVKLPVAESNLMQLLGHCVTEAKAKLDGTLRLGFDNGHFLTLFDESTQYESYEINNGELRILV